MWRSQALVVLLSAAALGADTFTCPENEITGLFADPDRCDWYWSCFKGEATLVKCGDGLAFEPARILQKEPCTYIPDVDCTGRDAVGEPKGTGVCLRQNGVFPHEDPDVCNRFYTCTDNLPVESTCNPGLHYNLDKRVCDWPNEANRGACEARVSLDGFTCDGKEYFTSSGQKIAHPRFPHPDDCSKFYICKQGRIPALSGCPEGEFFNLDTNQCDLAENVKDCLPASDEDYVYEDYEYPDKAAQADESTVPV